MFKENQFTILELLIVITILLVLVALLLPSLNKVKERTERLSELSDRRQVAMASILFTKDNAGLLPDRGKPTLAYALRYKLPTRNISKRDMNKTFVSPYISDTREARGQFMFCQSDLLKVRNQDEGHEEYSWTNSLKTRGTSYGTLNYYKMDYRGDSVFMVDPYDISTLSKAGRYPMWSCVINFTSNKSKWMGHDAILTRNIRPAGMNTVYTDGSGEWVDPKDIALYYRSTKHRIFIPNKGEVSGVQFMMDDF